MGVIGPATRAGYRRWTARRFAYPDSLSSEAEQVLLGSLFGDGCLTIPKCNTSPVYAESHGAAQDDYIRWKAAALDALHPRLRKRLPNGLDMRTMAVPLLAEYRTMFYPQGRKVVPEPALAQLGPLGLAVWFMDDGSVNHAGRYSVLCTDSWALDVQQRLCDWFAERWGLRPMPQFHKKSGSFLIQPRSCYRLRFHVDDTTALIRLIEPHILPLFRAKWRVDDPQRWLPAITKSQASMLGNAARTARIKAGLLTVGYHTGTIRLTSGQ